MPPRSLREHLRTHSRWTQGAALHDRGERRRRLSTDCTAGFGKVSAACWMLSPAISDRITRRRRSARNVASNYYECRARSVDHTSVSDVGRERGVQYGGEDGLTSESERERGAVRRRARSPSPKRLRAQERVYSCGRCFHLCGHPRRPNPRTRPLAGAWEQTHRSLTRSHIQRHVALQHGFRIPRDTQCPLCGGAAQEVTGAETP